MEYTVKIEKDGNFCSVGMLSEDGFQYAAQYLKNPEARPISASLPLQSEQFSPDKTRCFFEGLLPEGFTRKSVATWMHLPEDDYLAILAGLGRECLGAIMISDEAQPEEAGYRELTIDEVKSLAAEGATRSAMLVTESHLSLTGASGKAGLYYNGDENKWYQPYGTAPSTHIVKQSHVRLEGIVINELLCLRTAQECGITVPDCFILDTGGKTDGDILFATGRYDRKITYRKGTLDNLPVPDRLHQEDFAQAMGIAPAYKYEPADGAYLAGMFETLRLQSSDPLADQLKLWDMLIFNCLIGNTDNHLKNTSLLYNRNLSGARLAPAYDIVSTTAYDSGTRRLSMHIGDAKNLDDVNENSFRLAAQEAGLSEKAAIKRLTNMANQFEAALTESARTLADDGFSTAIQLKERILRRGGYRNL